MTSGTGLLVVAAALVGAGVALVVAPPAATPVPTHDARSVTRPSGAGLVRLVASTGAGAAAWVLLGGALGAVAAVVAALASARVLAGVEPPAVRRRREAAARELPHLVDLLAATLHSGSAPMEGLRRVCTALPGPAADRLRPVLSHVSLGGAPSQAWEMVADDVVLAPLARALVRSHRTGASVVAAVEQLADELEREAQAGAEDRARRVGVAAAMPLGVCLLPAFLLIGIVPTVAVMLESVTP